MKIARPPHLALAALGIALLACLLALGACSSGNGRGGEHPGDGGEHPGEGGDGAPPGDGGDGGPPGDGGEVEPSAERIWVRPAIGSLDPAGPEIASLRRGVEVMKGRPASDPTSWIYQANIHGTYDPPGPAAWDTCQHGSYYFLAWHRMYLYYFERILRAASGDQDLALPYWDYTDPERRALPLPLREPADASNPLFVAERNDGINEGSQLPESAVTYGHAFVFPNFTSPTGSGLSFGGQFQSGPVHYSSPHGQLESQPHDIIHVLVGGPGWMSDPNLAARDPVFWLHHANIDRLWGHWLALGGGRSNPSNPGWLDTTYRFFDADGSAVEVVVREVLDSVGDLHYRYDDAPAEPREPVPPPPQEEPTPERPRTVLAASEAGAVELGARPVTVPIDLPASAGRQVRDVAAAPGGGELALNVEGISYDRPGAYYEIYLNLPEGVEPDPAGPYYVGNLAFFGHKPADAGPEHEGASQTFRITPLVNQLQARGAWSEDFAVTFVLRELLPPEGQPGHRAPEEGTRLRFKRITVTAE